MSFVCRPCQFRSSFWRGHCPECGAWGSFTPSDQSARVSTAAHARSELLTIPGAAPRKVKRMPCGIEGLDTVLGGGLVCDSVVFLGGEPGIGKSTLVLEWLRAYIEADAPFSMLYASGEETLDQIRDRAARLGVDGKAQASLMAESQLEAIFEECLRLKARFLIIDSLQTAYLEAANASAGTITQLKAVPSRLMSFAKQKKVACLLIGHVTKEGEIAGPKYAEHIVDAVLEFKGEAAATGRVLKAGKNRYGSTIPVGLFEMHEQGLRAIAVPEEGTPS